MSELLRKEWRENRALIFGLLALGPAASLGVRWLMVLGDGKFHPADPVAAVIPFLLLIYVLAIGADLVAGDVVSGRIAFYAAQPVRPAAMWAAKAGFLFGTAALYLGWLLGTETLLLFFSGVDPTRLFTVGLVKFGVRLIPAVLAGAAVLFWSTLIDRGFAAVIAALGTIGLLVAIVWQLHPYPKMLKAAQLGLPALLLFVAFVAGSFLAFTRGRIHLGGRMRRLAMATTGFAVVFALPVGLATARAVQRLHIDLDDEDVFARVIQVDDAGERAVISLHRGQGLDRQLGVRKNMRVAAVSLEDGRIRDFGLLRDHGTRLPEVLGELGMLRKPWREIHYANGASAGQLRGRWEVSIPDGRTISLDARQRASRTANEHGVLIQRTRGKFASWVLWIDTGVLSPVPLVGQGVVLLPSSPDGQAFVRYGARGLARVAMDGSHHERVCETWWSASDGLSPAGGHLLGRSNRGLCLVRAAGSRVLPIRGFPLPSGRVESRWQANGTRFVVRSTEWLWVGDAADEEPTLTRLPIPADAGDLAWFDGERILTEGRRVVLWTLDGASRQLLPVKEIP